MRIDFERRYARQIVLPEVGDVGQQKLAHAKILVIGVGGLGAPLITYLASSGIGQLGIIDDDRVELSNLPRQIIHETGDIGRLKVESARDRVAELNPECEVRIYPYALTTENAAEIIANYDVIADGSDQFATRFAVNAACIALRIPLVSAAVSGFGGQLLTIAPHLAPQAGCYQCLVHPNAADERTCDLGILGPFAGQIGTMQAMEVLRVILGFPAFAAQLAIVDGKSGAQRLVNRQRDPNCPVCTAI